MKFRVYDKQEKKYVDLKNNPLWMDNEGDFYFISDLPCCSCEGMSFYSDRYVVEKYSSYCGHYEGDKFSVKLNSEETVTMILVFKRDRFELACYRGEAYFTLETGYIDSPDVKHIGNIHDGETDDKI